MQVSGCRRQSTSHMKRVQDIQPMRGVRPSPFSRHEARAESANTTRRIITFPSGTNLEAALRIGMPMLASDSI